MKRFSEQFKKQSESIRMRASEKDELRARLVSYMEYHPLPSHMLMKKAPQKAIVPAIASESFFVVPFNKIYTRSFAGVFVMCLIVGIPLIAEKSLPGDTLYAVKVQFNEEVRSSLSFSSYAKVEWETQRLGRRITEARLLASEGRLTDEAQASFAEAVQTHTDAAQREIAELRETDSDSAAIAEIAFASALAVQSEVLEGHIQNDTDAQQGEEGHSVLALTEVVDKARSSAESAQADAQPSYGKLLAAVEEQSTQVYELFTSVKKSASAEEVADVDRRLADIERKMKEAIARKEGTLALHTITIPARALAVTTNHSDELPPEVPATMMSAKMAVSDVATETPELIETADVPTTVETKATSTSAVTIEPSEEDAIVLLRTTLTDIQKLLNYLSDIDVRENVSINDLLPVTPTQEERTTEIMRIFDTTIQIEAEIHSRNIQSRLQKKVSFGLTEVDAYLAQITEALQQGNLDVARTAADSALTLITDIQKITSNEPFKPKTSEVLPSGTTTSPSVSL